MKKKNRNVKKKGDEVDEERTTSRYSSKRSRHDSYDDKVRDDRMEIDDEHRKRDRDDEDRKRDDRDEERRKKDEDHRKRDDEGHKKKRDEEYYSFKEDDHHRSKNRDERKRSRRDESDDRGRSKRDHKGKGNEGDEDRGKPKVENKGTFGGDNVNEEKGGGLRSLDVKNMNALRAQLGLRPLKIDENEDKKNIEKEQVKETKKEEVLDLETKIELLKEMRVKRQQKIKQKISTLGDSDNEEEDTMSWIKKAQQIKEEKKDAEKKASLLKHLQEEESDVSDDDPVALRQKKGYNTMQAIAGVKVLHDVTDFQEGTTILTLADRKLVEKGKIIDDDDELENAIMVQENKIKKINEVKSGKYKFNPYDDKSDTLLPQYDEGNVLEKEREDRKKNAFTITEEGIQVNSQIKEKDIKTKLEEAAKSISLIEGNVTYKPASDFYTQEELVQFKKNKPKKKKSRRRKNIADELIPLEDNDTHLISRQEREERQRASKAKEVADNLEKRESYKKAIEKAEADSKRIYEEEVINDEDDEELYASLARARKMAQERKKREEEISELVDKSAQDQKEAKKKDTRIIFNTTAEFIKSIPVSAQDDKGVQMDIDTDDPISGITAITKPKNEKKRKRSTDEMDTEEPPLKEIKIEEEHNTDESTIAEGSQNKIVEPIEDLMGEEPLVGASVGATLALIKSRGGLQSLSLDTITGRASDKKLEKINTEGDLVRLEYLDEMGRTMTPKEAFRRISYSFHGKMPGKNKQEKRMRRAEEQLRRKHMSTTDTPLMTLSAMQKTQEQSKLPYVMMGGNTTKILNEQRNVSGLATPQPQTKGPKTTISDDSENRSALGGTFKDIQRDSPAGEKVEEKKVSFGFK